MPCVQPITLSAGFVFLDYVHISQQLQHRTHVRLNVTADPLDPVTMGTEANTWGALLADCLDNHFSVTGWGTQSLTGVGLLLYTFASPYLGTHTGSSGAEDYRSRTVTMVGRGIPSGGTGCKGPALTRMFVGDTYNFTPGQKYINAGGDAALDALRDFFATNSVIWHDYYGQKATIRSAYPVQFNAYMQRRKGQ